VLATDTARKREDFLAATEKLLAPSAGPIEVEVEVGKVISKYKTTKHFHVAITDTTLDVTRKQDQIDAEAARHGFYVLRTPCPRKSWTRPAW
jgi:hypothetical protein